MGNAPGILKLCTAYLVVRHQRSTALTRNNATPLSSIYIVIDLVVRMLMLMRIRLMMWMMTQSCMWKWKQQQHGHGCRMQIRMLRMKLIKRLTINLLLAMCPWAM